MVLGLPDLLGPVLAPLLPLWRAPTGESPLESAMISLHALQATKLACFEQPIGVQMDVQLSRVLAERGWADAVHGVKRGSWQVVAPQETCCHCYK